VKLWSWPGTREAEAVIPDEPAAAKRGRSSHGNDNGSSQSQAHDVDILPVATLIGHTNQVSCLTVLDQKSTAAAAIATNLDMQNSANSNAGRFVVSGSWDHSLRLWDVDRFVAVREITCGKVVTDVSCVGNNGQVFASSHPDNTIRLWDGRLDASGSVMQLSLKGHNQWISSLASSPWNQNELASGSYDGSLRTWDIRSNRPVHTMAEAHQGKILCVAWDGSESRRGIFTGGDDKQLNHFTV
jgi:ribosome biogenesis protein YTM1